MSTEKYTDRDWDSFRNHTVGFVFQSYNLIPHQTILANVELALTIGGISRAEKTKKAEEALKKVGLEEHIHKKPSQLSGGQMQRVAIARALVNDPDILLADEPTGALDSDTSVQVMDLLKEVASDRLVVMVTHNPELAEKYATRIVRLKDGRIVADSDPYDPESDGSEPVHRSMGKTSMSFLTALSLSFNNLRTKKARTILVAFAGSIGIIGIAMILAMSNGVNRYIRSIEEDTLQGYPLQITDTSFDMTSFYTSFMETAMSSDADEAESGQEVSELRTVTEMFSNVDANDLASLREYIESGESDIYDYVKAIEYDYSLTPQIFTDSDSEVRQVNPNSSLTPLGFAATSGTGSFSSSFSSFHQMPADEDLYIDQYDVKAGRWPESYNECVLALTSQGQVSDVTLYILGKKDIKDLDELVRAFAEGATVEDTYDSTARYSYDEFVGISFRLANSADYYVYDGEYKVWTDKSRDKKYMEGLLRDSEKLTIVGVVQPKEDVTTPLLMRGINYPASLITHIAADAADSAIVKAQLRTSDIDVITGVPFGEENERMGIDLNSLFSVDEEAIGEAFSFDLDDLDLSSMSKMDLSKVDLSGMDLSGALNPGDMSSALPSLSQEDIAELLSGVKINVTAEEMETLFRTVLSGYMDYIAEDPSTDYSRLGSAVGDYLRSEDARELLRNDLRDIISENSENMITRSQLERIVENIMAGYPEYVESHSENGEGSAELLTEYLRSPAVQTIISNSAAELRDQLASMTVSREQAEKVAGDLYDGYTAYAKENGLPDPSKLSESVAGYISTPEAQKVIADGVAKAVDASELEKKATEMLSSYTGAIGNEISKMMGQAMSQITKPLMDSISKGLQGLMGGMNDDFQSMFNVDPEAMADAFTMNMDAEELQDLLSSLLSTEESNLDNNLRKLGYADLDDPSTITIYPANFDSKAEVKKILDGYNDTQKARGDEQKVIKYTDVADALISSVTTIVNAVSYVLIAFVGISLVVSSIMIGVITYISVLERSKEIGILRAIGASKRNISQVFNAETFIIGALAGIFGIGITWLLIIPANIILRALTGQPNISAVLPVPAAIILIGLSIALTLIGGIIPSKKAARRDPVAALRSE